MQEGTEEEVCWSDRLLISSASGQKEGSGDNKQTGTRISARVVCNVG